MKRELQLSDICSYIPYGLMAYFEYGNKTGIVSGLYDLPDNHDVKLRIDWSDAEHIWMYKPFLRPMSLLTSEITHKGEMFVPIDRVVTIFSGDTKNIKEDGSIWINRPHSNMQEWVNVIDLLNELKFDYRGLIDAGLAISLTDIKEGVYE